MTSTYSISGNALAAQRRVAVDQALNDIRTIASAQPLDRAVLARITARLEKLASLAELFTSADFPPPAVTQGVGASTRYRLNPEDGDDDVALYLNSINPGKTSIPHNHTTWAAIVAVQGQEQNRVYRRTDDGSEPAVARLEFEREVTVQPGTPIAFLPDDLHSIHVIGDRPTLHFHLYGRPLETLVQRIGVNLETGAVVNYNATQLEPSKAAA
ncbi:cysteine dioxygenase family protein [Variovorax sp. VRV01]|uniref:cysteine dioxygenase family protein n=1 Tax=Variovorax sp. VRV01 TaxID=2769259 RepID=UPI00177AFA1C|nr:cysteine dioxygenase family protein [Variovorax sp. VRV01]MBD9665423.1 cysteine dioxygenase family protein [Variovorax sp. VRV01]